MREILIPNNVFKHPALGLQKKSKIIFTSFSKKNFYLRFQVSAFVLQKNCVPINPFMNFDYNLAGLVEKNLIRIANNTMIQKCNELWAFGEISDGVLVEITLAKKFGKPIRFFSLSEKVSGIKEVKPRQVLLEDVSPWMWEWVLAGKKLSRWHPRLQLNKTYPLIFPTYSKRNFFWHMQITKFCIEKRKIPLNPFMLFRYFLGDMVPRKKVYQANNNIIRIADELWIFGEISDGVLSEIRIKKELGGKLKFLKIIDSDPVKFRKISPKGAVFEEENLERFRPVLKKE